MDYAAFIRIHRFKRYRTSCSLYFISQILRKILKRCFSSFTIILCINFDTNIRITFFVHNQTDDILQRIQSLSSFANKQTHIFTIKNDIHRSVFFIIVYCTVHTYIHCFEQPCQKILRMIHKVKLLTCFDHSWFTSDQSEKTCASFSDDFIFKLIAWHFKLNGSF